MPGEELGFDLFDLDDDFVEQLGSREAHAGLCHPDHEPAEAGASKPEGVPSCRRSPPTSQLH